MKEFVVATATEVIKEKYPWLLKDNEIEVYERPTHTVFGGKHHDTYGVLEFSGAVIIATSFSPYGRSTKEFGNLKDACHFCIKERFHFAK